MIVVSNDCGLKRLWSQTIVVSNDCGLKRFLVVSNDSSWSQTIPRGLKRFLVVSNDSSWSHRNVVSQECGLTWL